MGTPDERRLTYIWHTGFALIGSAIASAVVGDTST